MEKQRIVSIWNDNWASIKIATTVVALLLSSQSLQANNLCIDLFKPTVLQAGDNSFLLGKSPHFTTEKYQQHRELIFALQSESQFPKIIESDFQPDRELPNNGRGNLKVVIGNYSGQPAIMKISNSKTRTESQVFREARWLMFLNKFGIGPEFFGLVRTSEGHLGLVTEYVAGEPIGINTTQIETHVLQKHIYLVEQLGLKLKALNILYTPDMQLIITSDGRIELIDPEFFAFNIPVNNPFNPAFVPIDPITNTQSFSNILKRAVETQRQKQSSQNTLTSTTSFILDSSSTLTNSQRQIESIERQMSSALGFQAKLKIDPWEQFLDIVVVNSEQKQIATISLLHLQEQKTLSVDFIKTAPYNRIGLGLLLMKAALILHPEIEILKSTSLIADNQIELQRNLAAPGVDPIQALEKTPMYKLFAELGFTEIIPESITAHFSFAARRPERRIILF